MFFRIVIFALLGAMALLMIHLGLTGRVNKKRNMGKVEKKSSEEHVWLARALIFFSLLLVASIEVNVRMRGGLHLSTLFDIHLCFALGFLLVLLLLNFWATGEKSANHATLGCFLAILFCGMASTGICLILKM